MKNDVFSLLFVNKSSEIHICEFDPNQFRVQLRNVNYLSNLILTEFILRDAGVLHIIMLRRKRENKAVDRAGQDRVGQGRAIGQINPPGD